MQVPEARGRSFPMKRIIIVGGGFSGTSAAVQLVRRSAAALDITVVEPREHLGGGLAYSSDEPDHRLNGQPGMHSPDPADIGMFVRWCDEHGAYAADPAARLANGTTFLRRSVFRRFLQETVANHATWPTGSSIRHVRDFAVDVLPGAPVQTVVTAGGAALTCDMVVLAPGHTRARLPSSFGAGLADHTRMIVDPLATAQLQAVAPDERVLVLGSGLTAYDIVSTLLCAGHRGPIDVVSRRGLRPQPQRAPPAPGAAPLPPMLERLAAPPDAFIRAAGNPPTVRALLHALRRQIRTVERAGESWDGSFDHLRDMVGQVWPTMAAAEKRRFFRQLRPWYDTHRFRVAPQNARIVAAAEERGQVRFRAASIEGAASDGPDAPLRVALRERRASVAQASVYDRVINCTGVDSTHPSAVPLYAALLGRGMLTVDASGVGLAVDGRYRAIAQDGSAAQRLRLIGPPTLGARGDPLGSAFIGIQVYNMIPDLLAVLDIHL